MANDDRSFDVMQVCRNGHVLTEQLRGDPQGGASHCPRCGAATLWRCETCGRELIGAAQDLGMSLVGSRAPPSCCAHCGALFPWSQNPSRATPSETPFQLTTLLRRLPLAIRQLRSRHADRPPFLVQDRRDLEDLLRALLPLHFDAVRPECRTPSYAPTTQTDYLIGPLRLALTIKQVRAGTMDREIGAEREEDVLYYQRRQVRSLLILVHDPEGRLREPAALEAAWSGAAGELRTACVIAR